MGQVLWFVKAKEPEEEQKHNNSTESPLVFLAQPVLCTPVICPQIKELMKSAVNTSTVGMLLSCLCTFFKLRLICWHPERFSFPTDGRWVIWGGTLCPTHWKEYRTNCMMPLFKWRRGKEGFSRMMEERDVNRKPVWAGGSLYRRWTLWWPRSLQQCWL